MKEPTFVLTHKACVEHGRILTELSKALDLEYEPAVSMLLKALAEGGKLLVCGCGGSAAQASHFVAELQVRYATDRRALAAVALTSDGAILSAAANDLGWPQAYSRQIEALAHPGDCLVAYSTSGRSVVVLNALAAARKKGMTTLGITGERGFAQSADVELRVPSQVTARIQEMHLLITHLLVEGIERGIPA